LRLRRVPLPAIEDSEEFIEPLVGTEVARENLADIFVGMAVRTAH